MDDTHLREFLRSFWTLSDLAARQGDPDKIRFADELATHLGGPPAEMAVVTGEVPNHRYADWDTALAMLADAAPERRIIGVGGGEMRYHHTLSDFIADPHRQFGVGQVDWINVPVGFGQWRRAIGFGARLFTYSGIPVAVMQRRAHRRYGQEKGSVEVIAPDADVTTALLGAGRELATEHSVLRGKVVTFEETGFGPESQGVAFLERPSVAADDVILPADALDRIVGHVSGVAEHAAVLRSHGQHLKRGLLLYGPPGTGKTHTVRHLIHRNPDHTVVVLVGTALRFVTTAAAIARHLQPAIVMLEDCDLVAEDRGLHPGAKPLLFEVLDAMDGLDSDADVTFLLTTTSSRRSSAPSSSVPAGSTWRSRSRCRTPRVAAASSSCTPATSPTRTPPWPMRCAAPRGSRRPSREN